MAGTIVVDRIESDASYTSTINVANRITFSNTVNFGVFAGTAPVDGMYLPTTNNLAFTTASTERMRINSSGQLDLVNNPILTGGTANGVAYLNGSKVLTTGSALTFDGTTLTVASRGIAKGGMPAGSVLQVVSATRSTGTSTTSTSYVTSNLSAAITPTLSSSKILIMFHAHCSKNGDSGIWLSLKRGASQISEFIGNAFFEFNGNMGGSSCSIAYLDSPATTSSTTYEIFFKSQAGTSTANMFVNSAMGTITLMEIAA